jgi:hypothetical protein
MAGEGTDFLESSQLAVSSLLCVVIFSTEVRGGIYLLNAVKKSCCSCKVRHYAYPLCKSNKISRRCASKMTSFFIVPLSFTNHELSSMN